MSPTASRRSGLDTPSPMFTPKTSRSLRWISLVAAVALVSACPATEPADPFTLPEDERPFSISVGPDTSLLQSGLTAQVTAVVKTKGGTEVNTPVVFTSTDSTIGRVDS